MSQFQNLLTAAASDGRTERLRRTQLSSQDGDTSQDARNNADATM